ncbi:DUF4328 domain-containing protein [Rhizobium sp. KVB221]|uniref:DUF4328 domain-containing protein n=1 Tax=Rhizobium setariae TaxID=2801340 RepID=A0A937CKR7_9HYPH|nr:DUF4328 domain-containing protein [Rhizobium setariae]MBL0370761.1 DUF4328 domain-containing protein [Rhizobium setariae]
MNPEIQWRYAGVGKLTKTLHYLFYISLALIPAALILDVLEYNLLISLREHTFDPASDIVAMAEASDRNQFVMGIVQTCLVIATTCLWFIWVFKSNKLARAFGAATMKYSPAWSVGWYFVPILNLFRPYFAMKEIYLATLSPQDLWTSQASKDQLESLNFVKLWWLLWIVQSWLGRIAFKYSMKAETINELILSRKLVMASELISVVAMSTCILFLKRMWIAQSDAFEASKGALEPQAEPT